MNNVLQEKVRVAIERLHAFEPPDRYYLSYSGGKGSDCIKIFHPPRPPPTKDFAPYKI